MADKWDDELLMMQRMLRELSELNRGARRRVLTWLTDRDREAEQAAFEGTPGAPFVEVGAQDADE